MTAVTLLVLALTATGLPSFPEQWSEMVPISSPLSATGLEMIGHSLGVTVFKDPDADVIRLGAEGRLAATPAAVRAALLDYENQVGMIKRLSESTVLERGDQWLVVYERLNLPVIKDRDYVIFVTWGEDDGTLWMKYMELDRDHAGATHKAVTTPLHRGSWQFQPIDEGRATLLRYQVKLDLGGWLPKWMARAGAAREVPEVYAEICQMVGLDEDSETPCLIDKRRQDR